MSTAIFSSNESFWNLAQGTVVPLPCSVQNFRQICWWKWILSANTIMQLMRLKIISNRLPRLSQVLGGHFKKQNLSKICLKTWIQRCRSSEILFQWPYPVGLNMAVTLLHSVQNLTHYQLRNYPQRLRQMRFCEICIKHTFICCNNPLIKSTEWTIQLHFWPKSCTSLSDRLVQNFGQKWSWMVHSPMSMMACKPKFNFPWHASHRVMNLPMGPPQRFFKFQPWDK